MTEQMYDDLPLFPRYRRTDPETSREAAEESQRSGRMSQQRAEVLRLVEQNPNKTSAELAELGNMERHVPARRLCELVQAGFVVISGKRPCTTNGRNMQTYRRSGG